MGDQTNASTTDGAAPPSREELRRRLRDKIRGGRNHGGASRRTAPPSLADAMLQHGLDDAQLLSAARDCGTSRDRKAIVQALHSTLAQSDAQGNPNDDDDDECLPSFLQHAAPVSVDASPTDEEWEEILPASMSVSSKS